MNFSIWNKAIPHTEQLLFLLLWNGNDNLENKESFGSTNPNGGRQGYAL